jgi:hypothetical protein
MNTNVKNGSTRLWAVWMFTLLFLLSWLNPLSAQPPGNSPALLALQEKASREGSVRIIVQLDTSFTPEGALKSAQARQQRLGIARAQTVLLNRIPAGQIRSHREFSYTPLMAMEVTPAGLQTLMAGSGWTQIQEDKQYKLTLDDSAPLIGSTSIQSQGFGGAGQTIAVLDTGVDRNHPFLAGKVVAEACFSTNLKASGIKTACPNKKEIQIGSGAARPFGTNIFGREHGTHVAGIAAGGNPGIAFTGAAPDASLIAIQVFSIVKNTDCGGGLLCIGAASSDLISALEHVYSLRNTFNIASVNMSLGGGLFSSAAACGSDLLKLPIDLLRSVEIATIVSSGNDGSSSQLSSPACISSAISVGSTTKADAVSSFSNSASFLDLLAPGGSIQSSIPGSGYASFSGTSMAAPHVSGAWALVKSQVPSAMTVNQVLANLQTWGVPVLDNRNGITKPRLLVLFDTDGDGIANSIDTDDDNDGTPDISDDFPIDPTETTDTDGDGVGDNADVFPNDPDETVDTDGDNIGDNGDAFPLAPATFQLPGIIAGAQSCDNGLGAVVVKKFVSEATIDFDLSAFPLVTVDIQVPGSLEFPNTLTLSGMALFRNPKSGVIQLFGSDGAFIEMGLSGKYKMIPATQLWVSIKGKFQAKQQGVSPDCTIVGKFKAKLIN